MATLLNPLPNLQLEEVTVDRITRALLKETLDLVNLPIVFQIGKDEQLRAAYSKLSDDAKLILQHRIVRDMLWKAFLRVNDMLYTPPVGERH